MPPDNVGEEESPVISMVVEVWKKNQLEQFSRIHRIKGFPWRLRLYSRNGYMQVEVLCEKSKESELWQCDATIRMSDPLHVCKTYHLASWDEKKCVVIGELTNDIPIIKGELLKVDISMSKDEKWTYLSRPLLDPSEVSEEVFVIGEEKKNIKVHKEFLMSHSPFFGDLFTDFTEIPMEGVEYEELSNILAMACGFDGTSLTDDNVERVMELSRRFELPIVEDRVISYLLSSASSLAVYQKLDIAQLYDRPFLKEMLLARYEKAEALRGLVESPDFEQLSPETLRILFVKRCSIYRMLIGRGSKPVQTRVNCPNLDPNEPKDVTLLVGEKKKKKIKVNKKTMMSQSSFFDQLFNGPWKEKELKAIPIRNVEYEEFECILAMLYDSDITPLKGKNAEFLGRILRQSDFFEFKAVEYRVVSFLLSAYASYLTVHERLFIADQSKNKFLMDSFLPLYQKEVQLIALSELPQWEFLSIEALGALFKTFCISSTSR